MNKFISIIFLLLTGFASKGQVNLVPNPSFENHWMPPGDINSFYVCEDWFMATNRGSDYFWANSPYYTSSSPDNIAGYQMPHTGDVYVGIHTYPNASYIEVKLNDSLIEGEHYCIEFFVSLADGSNYALNNIGVFFSHDSVRVPTVSRIPQYVPQIINPSSNPLDDKLIWTNVNAEFDAIGNERYLIIGNFNLSQDDDTVHVGNNQDTVYFNTSYLYIDDVSVYSCGGLGYQEKDIRDVNIYPNPANDVLRISTQNIKGNCTIQLFNISGQLVYSYTGNAQAIEVPASNFNSGLYAVKLTDKNGKAIAKRVVINH